jgi:hypothetical protein
MGQAKFKITAHGCTIEIEGAEPFVRDQLEKFDDAIRAALAAAAAYAGPPATPAEPPVEPDPLASVDTAGLDEIFTQPRRFFRS